MNNLLEEIVEPLISMRIAKLLNDMATNQHMYSQLMKESEQHLEHIRHSIPSELEHPLYLYEDTLLLSHSILQSQIYLQGFKDALFLHGELTN